MDNQDLAFRRHLQAASGYYELEMWEDAWNKLEQISPEHRHIDPIPTLRVSILVGMKRWDSAAALADSLINQGARDGQLYLDGAYAIRRCRSLAEAHAFLLKGEHVLEKVAVFYFNLACYECQLGNIEQAKQRLTKAFNLDPSFRMVALEDEDLEPLWESF